MGGGGEAARRRRAAARGARVSRAALTVAEPERVEHGDAGAGRLADLGLARRGLAGAARLGGGGGAGGGGRAGRGRAVGHALAGFLKL
jgi:hypothetical protein